MKGSDAYITAFNAFGAPDHGVRAEARRAKLARDYDAIYIRTVLSVAGLPMWEWDALRSSELMDALEDGLAVREAITDFRYGRNLIANQVLGLIDESAVYRAVAEAAAVEEG